jgi:hypothetical protein
MFKKFFIFLISITVLLACSNNVQKESESEQENTKPITKQEKSKKSGGLIVEGKILETKDVAEYTYLLLGDGAGNQIWAAIPKTKVEVGKVVILENGFMMKNFESKTLKKTFDEIIFASGIADKKPKVVEDKPLGEATSVGSKSSRAPYMGTMVKKADSENAYTVEEVFARANELNKKKIVIKGKAVKVLNNIMGKNWIHIQDGTGSEDKSNYDLVVTTMENIEPDSVVVLEGIVAANKDFGYGYRYNVIVEDAKLSK